jgi:hypothetical protein
MSIFEEIVEDDLELMKSRFVRLTNQEIMALLDRDIYGYSLILAVENLLAEKNK